MRTGDFDRAAVVLSDALAGAALVGDKRLELRTLIEREFFRTFTDPEGSTDELVRVARPQFRCWRSSRTSSALRRHGGCAARPT
jgi:hypothetical protein